MNGFYRLSVFTIICLFIFINNSFSQEIHSLVESGELSKIEILVKDNPEILNEKDDYGYYPIHIAALNGHYEIVKYLVDKGCDYQIRSANGSTPLHLATKCNDLEIVRFLVENKVDINSRTNSGRNPVVIAAESGSKEVADYLLSKGAEIGTKGDDAADLLHKAAESGIQSITRKLLNEGADFSKKNTNGGTLLHSASSGGDTWLLEYLISVGFDNNKPDRYGRSPLYIAVLKGNSDAVKVLIKNGSHLNTRDFSGKSAYNVAGENSDEEILKLLSEAKAEKSPFRFPVLKGDYLELQPPGNNPVLFAPGIISSPLMEHSPPVFTKDLKQIFWTVFDMKSRISIVGMKHYDDRWHPPEEAVFTDNSTDCYPMLSPDGEKLFFTSRRFKGDVQYANYNRICYVEKTEKGWNTDPVLVDPVLSTINIIGQFSVSSDLSIYFAAFSKTGERNIDIYKSEYIDNKYTSPVIVSNFLNSPKSDWFPFIDPDEEYMLFISDRDGSIGGGDLYISFRTDENEWTESINLGEQINSEFGEWFPYVSPDKKYIFFGSTRNGNYDIYWADADIINNIRGISGIKK